MWVKFHDELRKGKKRGLPRAARFIYMELASEARPLRGTVELPIGMSLEDGLHDVLGGDRRELLKMFPLLTAHGGLDEEPMVAVEGTEGAWKIVLPAWKRWNGSDDSTDRVRAFRARQKTEAEQNQALGQPCNALQSVTVTDPVTVLEKSREDQIRSGSPLGPPSGGNPPEAQGPTVTTSEAQTAPATGTPPRRSKPKGSAQVVMPGTEAGEMRGRGSRKGMAIGDWAPRPEEFAKGGELGFDAERVALEAEKFRNYFQSNGKSKSNWDAAFRNWLIKANEIDGERSARSAYRQPALVQRAPDGSPFNDPEQIRTMSRAQPPPKLDASGEVEF